MRYYGKWAGNPNGTPESKNKCIASVMPRGRGRFPIGQQCSKGRGCGPDGLFCAVHARHRLAGQYVNVPDDEPAAKKGAPDA